MEWALQRDQALLALERGPLEERVLAIEKLVNSLHEKGARPAELVELIPKLVADPAEKLRRLGVTLGAALLDADEAEPFLISRLRDPGLEVRVEAAGQLADLALPSSRGALAAALEDANLAVRFEAARGMAALKHGAGLSVLCEALEDSLLRYRALGALAQLGDRRALPAVKAIFNRWFLPAFERTQAAGAVASLGDREGGTYLLQRTRKRWSEDRAMAIELLGEVKAEGARARLLEILASPKDTCRGAAARGLGRLGDPMAADALWRLFDAAELTDDLRLDCAEGLWRLLGLSARARLSAGRGAFKDSDAQAELDAMLDETESGGASDEGH